MADQEPSSQNIVQWQDENGRWHTTAENSFSHKQHLANEKAAEQVAAESVDDKPDERSGEKTDAPEQLTSTGSGRPAGPPRVDAKS